MENQIALSKIEVKDNHRARIHKTDLSELMVSMKQTGLLQPIGVVRNGNGKYEVVFGHRRYEAAKKLGWKKIPVIVRGRGKNDSDFYVEQLTENMHRQGITLRDTGSAIEKLTKLGLEYTEIASRLGFSVPKVRAYHEAYKELPVKARKLVASNVTPTSKNGKISNTQAIIISKVIRETGITGKKADALVNYAKKDNVSCEKLSIVSKLMRDEKATLSEAKATAEDVVRVRLTFLVNKKEMLNRFRNKRVFSKELYEWVKTNSSFPIVKMGGFGSAEPR